MMTGKIDTIKRIRTAFEWDLYTAKKFVDDNWESLVKHDEMAREKDKYSKFCSHPNQWAATNQGDPVSTDVLFERMKRLFTDS